jgi:hypothetical protein
MKKKPKHWYNGKDVEIAKNIFNAMWGLLFTAIATLLFIQLVKAFTQ